MNETVKKEIRWGIILQYIQMGLNIIISLIYTPIMIRTLGKSEYGLYNLAGSIISYLSLLSLGLGASYIRFYSRYKAKDDADEISKLNGLYMSVFLIIGLVALVAGLVLSFNVSIFFNETYTSNDLYIAKILMLFTAFNLALSFPMSVFTSYITSQEKFIFQKLINIGKTVMSPIVCIVILLLGHGSIGMVVVSTIISFIVDIINIIFCTKKLNMKFLFKKTESGLLKEIMIFSIFIAINELINQINWQTDKIIIGKMISSSAVAIYVVGATINSMYVNFSTAISNVYVPQIHKIVNEDPIDADSKFTEIFIKVGRIQFFVIMLVLTGFVFFGKPFILFWAGEGFEEAYYVALLLICPVTVPLIQNIGIEIQRAKNKHKFRSLVYSVMALLNVFISIILCKYYGIIGTAIGTTISLVVANGIIMNVYYHKVIKIDIRMFWKEILKSSLFLLVPILIGVLIFMFVQYSSVYELGLWIVLYTIIYVLSMFFLGLKREERESVLTKLKLKKKKEMW